jgi:glutathione synthase/RimK-type ligase-like ATP-grasp enzyme
MILILSQFADDKTVVHLRQMLEHYGAAPVVIGLTTIEDYAAFTITNRQGGGGKSILQLNGQTIDLRDVHAAWLWRGWQPERLLPRFRQLAKQRDYWSFFANEWSAFYKGFSLTLAYNGVFCINPPPFNLAWEEKCCQLWLAAEVGLQIPPTLYTTRLSVAQDFYQQHNQSIIYKPFHAYMRVREDQNDQTTYATKLLTNRVQPQDLVESEGFIPTPSIFQPYVPKDIELRIVVVGKKLFACAIHSQQSARSREDWRRYDLTRTPHEAYTLPDEIAAKLLQLMERLGLVFGSIDMIVTPSGEYVFLEVNPNGQFDWIAKLADLPIYEHLAAMLIAGKTEYSVDTLLEVTHVD